MSTIVTRAGKGSALTWTEGDANITNLNADKIEAVVEDTTPQLGGNLDVNGNAITSATNGNIAITPNGTGAVIIDGNEFPQTQGTVGQILVADGAGLLEWKNQEKLTALVYNADSVTINKGDPVYVFSAFGDQISVKLALNTGDATSAQTLGLANESIAPTATGLVICQGVMTNVNTAAYAAGDPLYLGSTAGSKTTTKPYAPNHLVYLGFVEKVNASSGRIYVRVQNGYELDEIHNVQITTTPADGQVLTYEAATSLWKPATPSTGGLTDVVNDTTPQLGGNLDVNGNAITSATNGNVRIEPNGSGNIALTPTTGKIILGALDFPTGTGTNGQVLTTNGSTAMTWSTVSAGATTLDGLSDVVITAAASGEVLYHNGTNWVDTPLSTLLASPGAIGGTTANVVNFNQLKMSTAALSTTWSSSGLAVVMPGKTITVTDTSGTAASGSVMAIASSTIASTNATTYTNAASLFVQNPTQGTNSTFTNTWAIYGNGRIRATDFTGTIGATTASTGAFTTLTASGAITLSPVSAAVAISPTGTGTVTINPAGALTINPTTASTINNTSIGATTASTGRFTTITSTIATGTAPLTVASTTKVVNLNAELVDGYHADEANTVSTIAVRSAGGIITATGFAGALNGTVGATTPAAGTFTSVNFKNPIEPIFDLGTTGGTIAPDPANGSVQKITLNSALTINAFTNATAGESLTLIIYGGTAYTSITSTMKFAGGVKTLTATAGCIDILTVYYDGTTYFASLGKGFA